MKRFGIIRFLLIASSLFLAPATKARLTAQPAAERAAANAGFILNVGVRELPERLSPATAWTDSETQALELLFESLVAPVYDQRYGQFYRPELAADVPAIVPGGRRFRLSPEARFSDGKPVTSLDIRHTAQLLKASRQAPEWHDLLQEPRVENDPRRIEFHFRQLPLEPLDRLSFKILPQTFGGKGLFRADDPVFAQQPAGSGPFRYAGREVHEGRTCAVFKANAHYHRTGLPHLREIRFYVSQDPAADFRDPVQPLHLLLDFPTGPMDARGAASTAQMHTLTGRRITFLAVNHRAPVLHNQNLRRALAHAIDREQILNEVFRGSTVELHGWSLRSRPLHPEFHHARNGPFPADCWANDPAVPAEPRDRESYRARLDQARSYAAKSGLKHIELTLKYPDDDPHVAQACGALADQAARLDTGAFAIRIKLLPLSPRKLKEAVDRHDYELAYFHVDYADETYWLWPLFDTRAEALQPGGSNFLGYRNDDVLEKLFRDTFRQRDFVKLRETMRAIHAHLYEHMPLIPLWQLDRHLAIHPDLELTLPRLDPLRVFAGVEDWTLASRERK